MTNETEDDREPRSRGISAATIVVWLLGLPLAYVLSSGPIVAAWQKLDWDYEPLRLFYAPLIKILNSGGNGWFVRSLNWWISLWGVH